MAVHKYSYIPDVYTHFIGRNIKLERTDRPKAPVKFSFKKKETTIIWALLDSGADNIILTEDIANFLNIDLSNSKEYKTQVVGGAEIKVKRHPIQVNLEGKQYNLEADFSDTHTFPILGRTFFKCFDSINFQEKDRKVEIVIHTSAN